MVRRLVSRKDKAATAFPGEMQITVPKGHSKPSARHRETVPSLHVSVASRRYYGEEHRTPTTPQSMQTTVPLSNASSLTIDSYSRYLSTRQGDMLQSTIAQPIRYEGSIAAEPPLKYSVPIASNLQVNGLSTTNEARHIRSKSMMGTVGRRPTAPNVTVRARDEESLRLTAGNETAREGTSTGMLFNSTERAWPAREERVDKREMVTSTAKNSGPSTSKSPSGQFRRMAGKAGMVAKLPPRKSTPKAVCKTETIVDCNPLSVEYSKQAASLKSLATILSPETRPRNSGNVSSNLGTLPLREKNSKTRMAARVSACVDPAATHAIKDKPSRPECSLLNHKVSEQKELNSAPRKVVENRESNRPETTLQTTKTGKTGRAKSGWISRVKTGRKGRVGDRAQPPTINCVDKSIELFVPSTRRGLDPKAGSNGTSAKFGCKQPPFNTPPTRSEKRIRSSSVAVSGEAIQPKMEVRDEGRTRTSPSPRPFELETGELFEVAIGEEVSPRQVSPEEETSDSETLLIRVTMRHISGVCMRQGKNRGSQLRSKDNSLVVGYSEITSLPAGVTASTKPVESKPITSHLKNGGKSAFLLEWSRRNGDDQKRNSMYCSVRLNNERGKSDDDTPDTETLSILIGVRRGEEKLPLGIALLKVNRASVSSKKVELTVQPIKPCLRKGIFGASKVATTGRSFRHDNWVYELSETAVLQAGMYVQRCGDKANDHQSYDTSRESLFADLDVQSDPTPFIRPVSTKYSLTTPPPSVNKPTTSARRSYVAQQMVSTSKAHKKNRPSSTTNKFEASTAKGKATSSLDLAVKRRIGLIEGQRGDRQSLVRLRVIGTRNERQDVINTSDSGLQTVIVGDCVASSSRKKLNKAKSDNVIDNRTSTEAIRRQSRENGANSQPGFRYPQGPISIPGVQVAGVAEQAQHFEIDETIADKMERLEASQQTTENTQYATRPLSSLGVEITERCFAEMQKGAFGSDAKDDARAIGSEQVEIGSNIEKANRSPVSMDATEGTMFSELSRGNTSLDLEDESSAVTDNSYVEAITVPSHFSDVESETPAPNLQAGYGKSLRQIHHNLSLSDAGSLLSYRVDEIGSVVDQAATFLENIRIGMYSYESNVSGETSDISMSLMSRHAPSKSPSAPYSDSMGSSSLEERVSGDYSDDYTGDIRSDVGSDVLSFDIVGADNLSFEFDSPHNTSYRHGVQHRS